MTFVPDDFVVPQEWHGDFFRLEPLGVEHNAGDHAAWTASVDHIRATPGFESADWPPEAMSPADNRADLAVHAREFVQRVRFAYTVKEVPGEEIIGCVYIARPRDAENDVWVTSWVRADRTEYDVPLARAITGWLRRDWPFGRIDYRDFD